MLRPIQALCDSACWTQGPVTAVGFRLRATALSACMLAGTSSSCLVSGVESTSTQIFCHDAALASFSLVTSTGHAARFVFRHGVAWLCLLGCTQRGIGQVILNHRAEPVRPNARRPSWMLRVKKSSGSLCSSVCPGFTTSSLEREAIALP